MPVSWSYYLRLRNITLQEYIERNSISNYEQLLSKINRKDVEPPLKIEVEKYFIVNAPAKAPAARAKTSSESSKDSIDAAKISSSASQKTDISKRKPRRRIKKTTKSSAKK